MDAIDGDPRNRLRVFASGWEIQQLRATVFTLTPPSPTDAEDWWLQATGQQAEETRSRPREGVLQLNGNFKEKRLALNSQPDRVDWLLEDPPPPMPDIREAAEPFFMLVLDWLQQYHPMNRLALGAILAKPVVNRQEGYEEIAPLIPSVTLDPQNSSDFFYQINRPRFSSTVSNTKINRLCKWSVAQVGIIQIDVNLENPTSHIVPEQSLYACRLELDINTSPESKEQLDHPNKIFQEMIDWGNEISEKGDVP